MADCEPHALPLFQAPRFVEPCYGSPGETALFPVLGRPPTSSLLLLQPLPSTRFSPFSELWTSASFSLCTMISAFQCVPFHSMCCSLLPACLPHLPKEREALGAKTTDDTPLTPSQTPRTKEAPWRHSEKHTLVFPECWGQEFCCDYCFRNILHSVH